MPRDPRIRWLAGLWRRRSFISGRSLTVEGRMRVPSPAPRLLSGMAPRRPWSRRGLCARAARPMCRCPSRGAVPCSGSGSRSGSIVRRRRHADSCPGTPEGCRQPRTPRDAALLPSVARNRLLPGAPLAPKTPAARQPRRCTRNPRAAPPATQRTDRWPSLAGLSLRHGEAVVIVSAASATVCRVERQPERHPPRRSLLGETGSAGSAPTASSRSDLRRSELDVGPRPCHSANRRPPGCNSAALLRSGSSWTGALETRPSPASAGLGRR